MTVANLKTYIRNKYKGHFWTVRVEEGQFTSGVKRKYLSAYIDSFGWFGSGTVDKDGNPSKVSKADQLFEILKEKEDANNES